MKDRKIKLACPTCERKLKLGDSQIGKPVVCPKCHTKFRINNSMIAEVIGRGSSYSNTESIERDQELVGPPSTGKGAFEDIDVLFAPEAVEEHVRQIERVPAPEQPPSPTPSSAAQRWQRDKQVETKLDRRMGQNGIGLLIFAAALGLLPLFGASVNELQPLLPYLPWTAVGVAFVGTVLYTSSKRRRGFGTIILSMFPLVFICLAATASQLYLNYFTPANQPPIAEQGAGEPDAEAGTDEQPPKTTAGR